MDGAEGLNPVDDSYGVTPRSTTPLTLLHAQQPARHDVGTVLVLREFLLGADGLSHIPISYVFDGWFCRLPPGRSDLPRV